MLGKFEYLFGCFSFLDFKIQTRNLDEKIEGKLDWSMSLKWWLVEGCIESGNSCCEKDVNPTYYD